MTHAPHPPLARGTAWAAATVLAACAVAPASGPKTGPADAVDAGVVAVLSDGDHEASTYATGRLAPAQAGRRDTLTVMRRTSAGWQSAAVEVSNSVTAAPEVLRLAPDGRTAFVVERLAPRTDGVTLARDLAPGRRLFAVDVATGDAARIADTVDVAPFPEALAVAPAGDRVAVVSNTADAAWLQVVPFGRGRFGPVQSFRLDRLGVTGRASGPRAGITASNVDWHPSGRFLAVNLHTADRVAFFRIDAAGDGVAVTPWGAPVATGTDPFVGRFTPDGRHFLTADWGRDLQATTLAGRLPEAPSAVSVIRLGDPDAGPTADHRRIGSTPTDPSSEGLAVSPDGRLVATINMRGTALAPDHPRHDRAASVTLLQFDPGSGSLRRLQNAPLDGVLPEGGTFDLSGRHFLATVYEGHAGAGAAGGAGVEVFRVNRDGEPRLEPLGRWPFPPGAHHVDVAR